MILEDYDEIYSIIDRYLDLQNKIKVEYIYMLKLIVVLICLV